MAGEPDAAVAHRDRYVQVFAIVSGHIAGVIAARDRAIARFERRQAIQTQNALLAAMILFTAGGLLILSG